MGCPTCMPYADVARQVVKVQNSVDIIYFSLVFFHVDFAVVYGCDTYGIVAAVFKSLQRSMYHRRSVSFLQYTAENSTHFLSPNFSVPSLLSNIQGFLLIRIFR